MSHDDPTERGTPRSAFRYVAMLGAVLILGGIVPLAGCSSTSGGGSTPPRSQVIVLPPGQTIVCANGAPPPCR